VPVVPVAQNRVGIASVSDAKLQPADLSGTGLQGIGAAFGQVASAGAQFAEQAYKRQQDEQIAAAGKATADLRLQATQAVIDLRNNAGPGGEGHAKSADEWFAENSAPILDNITDKKVRREVEGQLASMHTSFVSGEMEWEDGQRRQKLATDENQATSTGASRIAIAPDLKSAQGVYQEERDAAHARIDKYNIDDDAKAKMRTGVDQHLTQAALDVGIRTDWKATKELLDKGAFNALPEERIKQGYQEAETEQRRADAALKAQQALANKAANEYIATVKARQSAGIVVPPADIDQAAKLAGETGNTSTQVELAAMRITNGVNRESQAWTPSQYDAEISRLRAKGEKATPDEQVRLKAIEDIAPSRKSEFANNAGNWAALSGHPAPPINWSDPSTIAARQSWQTTVSQAAGQPVAFLQPAEVSQLHAVYASSPAGRLQAINTIGAIGGHTAEAAMRQVAPDDALAARVVLLNQPARQSTLAGMEVRKADKTIIDGTAPGTPGADALEKYKRDVEPALALLRPEDASATFEIARNMYANWAHQNGVHDFNEAAFGTFLHTALGAKKDANGVFHGGVGYWNDAPVWLPSRQSQQQFETVMSRILWKPDDPRAPVFANGQPMTPADIRKLTPVQRPDGRYEFHGPNGVAATNRNHGFWTIDLDKFGKGMGIAP
jgi:hypothetical protein